jgi:hypothetical protein
MEYTIVLNKLPESLEELQALPEAERAKPEQTAALTIAALCLYPKDKEESCRMLDWLRGPRPMSPMEKQFIRDRFMDGKDYIPRSYFAGAVPENDYQPSLPLTLVFRDRASQPVEKEYRILDVRSGGADSPRSVTLRLKPSTGEWFLWEQMLLAGIRVPTSQDEWA